MKFNFVSIILLAVSVYRFCVCQEEHDNLHADSSTTVNELYLPAYLGRWYQTYSSIIPEKTFEKNGVCITADYYNASVINTTSSVLTSFKLINSQRYYY